MGKVQFSSLLVSRSCSSNGLCLPLCSAREGISGGLSTPNWGCRSWEEQHEHYVNSKEHEEVCL